MIEEISMVRDAFNGEKFDVSSLKNDLNNSVKTESILTLVLLCGCSVVLFTLFKSQLQKGL